MNRPLNQELRFPKFLAGLAAAKESRPNVLVIKDRPFFMYFAIKMPHYPYQGDPKWLEHYQKLPYP